MLYKVISSQKFSRRLPLFQPVNFAGSRHLATTLDMHLMCHIWVYLVNNLNITCNLKLEPDYMIHLHACIFTVYTTMSKFSWKNLHDFTWLFQPVNFAGSRHLATTLDMHLRCHIWVYLVNNLNITCNLKLEPDYMIHLHACIFTVYTTMSKFSWKNLHDCTKALNIVWEKMFCMPYQNES